MTRRTLLEAAAVAALNIDKLPGQPPGRAAETVSVENSKLRISFEISEASIRCTQIHNKSTGFEHLTRASALFGFTDSSGASCESDSGVLIESHRRSRNGRRLEFRGRAAAFPLRFALRIDIPGQDGIALVRVDLANTGSAALSVRVAAPKIGGLATRGRRRPMMAAIPQEAAGVVSLEGQPAKLGMQVNQKIGLPTAMNVMEVACIWDPDGGSGLFFADGEGDVDRGVAPIQFTLAGDSITGHSLVSLDPGQSATFPVIVLGVYDSGGWRIPIDDYVARHRPHWQFPKSPAWLRDQGAIYSFSGAGAGAIYMKYPQQNLAARIQSFENLPKLLEEAMSLGTNILYLWDYWEGATEGGRPPYWNKGDYIPRKDLGGETAFRAGIRRLHERGGRVILYVEPFIVFWYSNLGREKGPLWAARDASGRLYSQYPQNYTMSPSFEPWQEYMAEVSARLIRDYDADGIYLDSWGWQSNWPMKTEADGVLRSPAEYNAGVLELTRRVRTAIRSVKPDAVVLGESTSGALGRCWDGGLSADFAWLAPQNKNRIVASPVRYAMPELNIFSNGRDLNELNQVFAAGHHLALLNANLPDAPYIRKLVSIRQTYKDALIYGKQLRQPPTGDPDTISYLYQGGAKQVLLVVNISDRQYSGQVELEIPRTSEWRDLLTGQLMAAKNGSLALNMPGKTLRALLREKPGPGPGPPRRLP